MKLLLPLVIALLGLGAGVGAGLALKPAPEPEHAAACPEHSEPPCEPAAGDPDPDVRKLVRVARRHHVTIVPELDAPGHLQAALEPHPELQLTNAAGQKQPDKLDVTLPEARDFIADLLDEYLPLFPGPWWHTGADEYLGIASTEQDYEFYPQLEAYADAKYGEELCAWITMKTGATALDAAAVREFCDGRLSHYKIPRYVMVVDAFPMTVTGKVQKYKLREQAIADLELESAAAIETA